MADFTPQELAYFGPHEQFGPDEVFIRNGRPLKGAAAAQALLETFFEVIQSATDAEPRLFNPATDVQDYARTTTRPGIPRSTDEWQPHQAESKDEARDALLSLDCPPRPFSSDASQVLMSNPPKDLSSLLPDSGDDGLAAA